MSNILSSEFIIKISYTIEKKPKHLSLNTGYEDENIVVNWDINHQDKASTLSIHIIPKCVMALDVLDVVFDFPLQSYPRIFVNGFQSWTESQERSMNDKLPHLSSLAKRFNYKYQFTKYGDYEFVNIKKGNGYFHGFTYSYLRENERIQLMGSLNEANGFTIFEHQVPNHKIIIHKDVDGVLIDSPMSMELFFYEGTEASAFDTYFKAMAIETPKQPKRFGWTSWYNYYQNITEEIMTQNLDAANALDNKMNIIQIDDGFQTAVGDWLSVDAKKFPHGMKAIADAIKAQGSIPGIWLAPFVVQKSAKLVSDHPEWILKDAAGHFEMAGYGWGGNYALDLENDAVKEYLHNCFDVILNDWGFELVKLDFLYAATLGHHPTKTRGQRSAEAMDFLRLCVKDKLILGCGVCLGSAFGKVDYCRIGPDVSLDWDGPWYYQYIHRERVSTKNAILNSIGRRHLDQRAFLNDPDVFILRNNNVKMSHSQKEVLAQVNRLFGSLLFTSDLVSDYDEIQNKLWKITTDLKPKEIISVIYPTKNGIIIHYREDHHEHRAFLNLSAEPITFENGYSIAPFTIEISD